NDTIMIDKETKLVAEKVGQLMPLSETTGIAITIPIFQFGCFLLPPKFFNSFVVCTNSTNNSLTDSNEILRSSTNSSQKPFSERFMDSIDQIRSRNKRQLIDNYTIVAIINRLLASQTFYFVPNNGPGTNVYNLPRFLGIDYKRNTSLAWHNGDNVMNNCHFGKITFCHVLPPMVHKIEHSCLQSMFAREKINTCSFIESSEKPPYVRSIDDNKWIISVAEDLYCLMRDSDESMDENMDDIDNDNDSIIIKKFAMVNLPCKYDLNCSKKIQLKSMKCKRNSVMDYYLISNCDYFKSEELIKLLDGNQINES
ncbi:unnamed protein product, partial [Didymodactylos carnosus]